MQYSSSSSYLFWKLLILFFVTNVVTRDTVGRKEEKASNQLDEFVCMDCTERTQVYDKWWNITLSYK